MVQDLRIVGAEFDRANVPRRRERHRDHEVAEHVGGARLQRVGLRQIEDEIGFPELPASGPLWWSGTIGWIAVVGSLRYPSLNDLDLFIAEPALVEKVAVARFGRPRRHVPRPGGAGDGV